MKFQIPQFIDIEDKIFGPFSFKQFIYLGGGAGLIFVLYKALPILIAIIFIVPVAGFSLALAFYKINNKPFIQVLQAGFTYALSKKLYIWKKKEKKTKKPGEEKEEKSNIFVPRLSESKLKDIAWSLDVQESIYAGQDKS